LSTGRVKWVATGGQEGDERTGADPHCPAERSSSPQSNFLCNLGYGSGEKLFPRNPRLSFEEVCEIL